MSKNNESLSPCKTISSLGACDDNKIFYNFHQQSDDGNHDTNHHGIPHHNEYILIQNVLAELTYELVFVDNTCLYVPG